MKEEINNNKKHLIASSFLSIILSLVIGSIIGLKLDSLGWGTSAGIASLLIHISMLLLIYTLASKVSWYSNYISLLTISAIFLTIIFFVPTKIIEPHLSSKKAPEYIIYYLDKWNFHASLMRVVQTILVLISIVCSLLVAMQINHSKTKIVKWLAFVSAVSIGILSAFNFGEKANNFRSAFRLLNTAVMKYESVPDYSMEQLIDVYYKAENVIGNVEVNIK